MASTYVNNLRLEEIGTGEQSGTWGDTTNTNLEIIGQAVAWGTRAIANASTDNITITDGALDADRCLGLKLTGGGQACTVTLLPNTSSKTWFMYNATAAALTFTCGSGANVIIPAGQTKVIATDGLGSGGVVHDLLTAVNLAGITQTAAVTTQGTLTVGVDDTGYDVKFFGATSGKSLLWDESADSLIVTGTTTLVGTTNLDAVDIDGNVQLDGTFTVGVDDTGKDVKFFGATSGKYTLWDESADTLYVSGDLATVTAGTSNVVIGVNAGNSIASGGNYNVTVGDEAGTALTTGDNNTFIGYAAGDAINTAGTNTAVGYNALTADTKGTKSVAIGSGALETQNFTSDASSYNTAVGYNAGNDVTTGTENTFIGQGAGENYTTGALNTAVGSFALNAYDVTGTGAHNSAFGKNTLLRNTSGAANTSIGTYSLQANTTASNNTAVGYQAGYSNTEGTGLLALGRAAGYGNTTASYNTFVGESSGYTTSTGASNTALGNGSLYDNTTGANNTAVGASALANNTTAADSTAVGYQALLDNTTGASNTAVGFSALANNTTATYNVAMGRDSLFTNTTGANNTAIGSTALTACTTGYGNVSVGMESLYSSTTGYGNTAVGKGSCRQNTTGANNTAIGINAGYTNVSSCCNVNVGYQAGYNQTAANNVSVGTEAGFSTTTGGANTMIGHNAGRLHTTGDNNIFVGTSTGSYSVNTTTGLRNNIIGSYSHTTAADSQYANGMGYFIACAAGYTTLGNQGSDIRAAHGNVTWATVSDERYKKDIVNSTAGLSFINDLTPRTFKYKNLGDLPEAFRSYEADSTEVFKNSYTNHGFIAQEVKVAIDAHSEIKDGFSLWDDRDDGSQEVAEAALIPMLVKSIQELSTALDAAVARIATLEG